MRIIMDKQADAMYIMFSGKRAVRADELTPDIIVDYAKDGSVVGLDVQRMSLLSRKRAGQKVRPADRAVAFELVPA